VAPILAQAGRTGLAHQYAGTGWTATQRSIWDDELARADTVPVIAFSTNLAGPVLYTYGTPEKARFLPGIVAGDVWWCQGC
jgi:alkylation response protein AidB-like acyl-CoA dehydrogenase